MAAGAGYLVETKTIAIGGYTLAKQADSSTEHGKSVLCYFALLVACVSKKAKKELR